MKQTTRSVFTRIEEQRSEFMSLYDGLSSEQLRFKPGPGEWNLLQVMRHLVTAEKQSLLLIMRKTGRIERVSKAGAGARIRHLILRLALFLPIKFKAPKVADVTEDYPDLDQMKTEWDEVREGVRELIESSDDDFFTKAVYRHPRAGDMSLKQALEFFAMHLSHHMNQVRRIIGNSDSSAK